MSATGGLLRKASVRLMGHAARVMPAARSEWAWAMQNELAHIDRDAAALRWATGCVFAGYAERFKAVSLLRDGGSMQYHLISMACLLVALACSIAEVGAGLFGLAGSAVFSLAVIGVIVECTFWSRVAGRPHPNVATAPSISVLLDVAFACYASLVAGLALWGGIVWWISADEAKPLDEPLRQLLQLSGALSLAYAIALALLLAVPFRNGALWARWAVPVLILAVLAVGALSSTALWEPRLIAQSAAIAAVGLALSLSARRPVDDTGSRLTPG